MRIAFVVLVLTVSAVAAACGTGAGEVAGSRPDSVPAAPATEAPAEGRPQPPDPAAAPTAPIASVAPATQTPTPAESPVPSCSAEVILPVVDTALSSPPDLRIVSVDVTHCRDGDARVLAHPDNSGCREPGVDPCFEDSEQVFLHGAEGHWTILSSSTGVDCAGDPDLGSKLEAACRALGLRA